ncbi:MAG: hypothetical protein WKG01_36820 [Kofleriaceae bacterium]
MRSIHGHDIDIDRSPTPPAAPAAPTTTGETAGFDEDVGIDRRDARGSATTTGPKTWFDYTGVPAAPELAFAMRTVPATRRRCVTAGP